MPKQALENLTESMFYVLMALTRGDACGAEITAFAAQISGGAVRLGPATLYTLLARFEKEGFLTEAGTVGCKRYYRLTAAGKAAYEGERARLQRCLADADRARMTAPATLPKGGQRDEEEGYRHPSDPLPVL
ncbi:PadR family transcriptional regulator [uncultured Subdoligranulum sp.]|uniref:PadR family transcriptional regulator n=1 Tax=uncultured Subdoligranulum sp. TaxID=512298 RepID=UPI0025DC6415|nr:PadR family transcriptional regulator [uncultured Subdoligranulum sp.]